MTKWNGQGWEGEEGQSEVAGEGEGVDDVAREGKRCQTGSVSGEEYQERRGEACLRGRERDLTRMTDPRGVTGKE